VCARMQLWHWAILETHEPLSRSLPPYALKMIPTICDKVQQER